jgi:hemerythrin
MSTTPPFPWSDSFLLGYAPMDDTHREFVEIVDALLVAPDADFARHLGLFQTHAIEHFKQESKWMKATLFPATDCHIDEHDAVLKSVQEALDHLSNGGEVAICRSLVDELVRWFPGHADYMDAALAQWIVKQKLGGTPVVVRRGVLQECSSAAEKV